MNKKIELSISGMDCASCALTIEKAIRKVKGIENVSVNFASEKASVEYLEEKTHLDEIKKAIEDAGYKVISTSNNEDLLTLKVIGMDSPHCAGIVEKALQNKKGIKKADR